MPSRYMFIPSAVAVILLTWLPCTVSGMTIKPNVPSKFGKIHGLLQSNDATLPSTSSSSSDRRLGRLASASVAAPSSLPFRGGGGAASVTTAASATLVRLYMGYVQLCEKKPVLTKSVTAAFVNAIGDILSQVVAASVTQSPLHIKWNRLGAFFLCGLLYVGPFVHLWYEQLWKLGRWMEQKYGSSKTWQTVAQLFMDQTVGVAIFFPSYFYVYEYLEALVSWRVPSFLAAHAQCKAQLASVLIMQYYIWPISNWINFAYVPESLRVLFSNLVAVFWNAFLCTRIA